MFLSYFFQRFMFERQDAGSKSQRSRSKQYRKSHAWGHAITPVNKRAEQTGDRGRPGCAEICQSEKTSRLVPGNNIG
jgi:hypothetical protein